MIARIVEYGIIALAVMVALNQIGIAPNLVTILFGGIVFMLALAAGLAFGLGGRETAGQLWQQWYGGGQQLAAQVRQSGGSTSGTDGGPRLPEPRQTTVATATTSRETTDGWRKSVALKLREARQLVPQGAESSTLATRLEELLAMVERRPQSAPVGRTENPRYVS